MFLAKAEFNNKKATIKYNQGKSKDRRITLPLKI